MTRFQWTDPRTIDDAQRSMDQYLAQDSASFSGLWPESKPPGAGATARTVGDLTAPSADPDDGILLAVDGTLLRPVHRDGEKFSFIVPRHARSVWLRSRASAAARDRSTGLKVREITLRHRAAEVVIPPDDPRLVMGWHGVEHHGAAMWRRIGEAAELPWTAVPEPVVVTVHRLPTGPDTETRVRFTPETIPAPARTPDVPALEANGPIHLQWCLGMYSSGSTWAFNAIRSVGGIVLASGPRDGIYAETVDPFPADWFTSEALVIKSHHPDEVAWALLLRHADRIWITIRDPRDAVASAATYMFPDFTSALDAVEQSALCCESAVDDPRAMVLRYEDGFIDDPATLDRFAAAFGRTLAAADRDRLFEQTRRSAIEAMILGLAPEATVDDGYRGHRVHLDTQWHTHHVHRTGEIGRWRNSLTAEQLAEIDRRLGSWMRRFGYDAW